PIDLVLAIGGDGTVLHVSHLFQGPVPPVVGFGGGGLGFLLPFHINDLPHVLKELMRPGKEFEVLHRMRLQSWIVGEQREATGLITVPTLALNEVLLHRGASAHMIRLSISIHSTPLTEALADGLLLSTPTGSTAYSLSTGGPIVSPRVPGILLSPVCPRSLSFRNLVLDEGAEVAVQICGTSRSNALLTVDGRDVRFLSPGEKLFVKKGPEPVPCVMPPMLSSGSGSPASEGHEGGEGRHWNDDWVKDINSMLRFNYGFASKRLLSDT
ncbi:ATP-NAD kinase, partial [Atractiella rhizophila]